MMPAATFLEWVGGMCVAFGGATFIFTLLGVVMLSKNKPGKK